MTPAAAEWVQKAEGDFATAQREAVAVPVPNFDAAGYHAQQCAEKYLKARLAEAGAAFPKTHDLQALLGLVLPVEPAWGHLQPELNWLTSLAIEVRYPGMSATQSDATRAIRTATAVRRLVRTAFGLSV